MSAIQVIIVEDDAELAELVQSGLTTYGCQADSASTSTELFHKLKSKRYDLIVLDIMLPEEDGLSICKRLRASSENYCQTPVIITSALGDTSDKVLGLELGADDYLPKPFAMRELIARIRAVLRRANGSAIKIQAARCASASLIVFDDWKLNLFSRYLLNKDNEAITLSKTEFLLLKLLLDNAQIVLTREQIINHLGNTEAYDRSIDVQINRLRNKLGDNNKVNPIIRTIRGAGYMLDREVAYSAE